MFRCCFQRKNKNDTAATKAPDLKKTVKEQDWEETSHILNHHPKLAKEKLAEDEFDILWKDAPLETIQALLTPWPEVKCFCGNLVKTKIFYQQWDFLKSILHAYPNIITTDDVTYACAYDAPIDVFELMLDQQPNAPLEDPRTIFVLIEEHKLQHFLAVLDRHPTITELKEEDLHLTPLLYIFQIKKTMNVDWISPILHLNPNAAKQKDFDGKTTLHLAYQHGASSELIEMIQQAYPEAKKERDNLGRLPKDLANQSEKTVFTAANETLILRDKLYKENNSYPDNAVVVCRGDMLIRDPPTAENEEDQETYKKYSEQVLTREQIFGTLLNEFLKIVGIKDQDVIQKAAAIQALGAQYLSNKNDTIINFGESENPGYWFQQEVLKLVMRVYHETQYPLYDFDPSIVRDATFCMNYLNDRKNGEPSPKPRDQHANAYNELTQWLTEGLDKSSYTLQGPVLKPLQSLFNKLFIRRGQTSVSVIGDMVRGTLLLDNMAMLVEVVKRINNTFPNITENQFRHPDKCTGLADFLTYVHDRLKYLPGGGSDVLPYRFKANSSQKKKEKPLWYNLNFFLQIPEYHRVGFSEMFVACELQIGVEEEINKHRKSHVAYERDRILSNQPLLKNYDAMEKEKDEDRSLQISNCTEEDNKLIEKILFGKIATEVLIPHATAGNDNSMLFENGSFSIARAQVEAGSFEKPERLCINNRSLNWIASGKGRFVDVPAACVVAAGPYELDRTKRYFVDSFVLKNIHDEDFWGTVGLYAHVGPYLIQIACGCVGYKDEEDIAAVKSGQNFSYLEQMCPVPTGTTALEVIVYGQFDDKDGEFGFDRMDLSLTVLDIE